MGSNEPESFSFKKPKVESKEYRKNYSQLTKHKHFSHNYAGLHARPFPVLTTPFRISQLCFLHDETDSHESELILLREICQRYSVNSPGKGISCFYQVLGGYEIRWERHTEFSSYTFLLNDSNEKPFISTPIELIPIDWLQRLPGKVISAVHLEALDIESVNLEKDSLRQYFEGQRLIGSKLHHGEASIYSAMRLHNDSFNRILLVNNNLNECQNGRVLRTLLEIEAYRNMALLAFPLAQEVSAKVSQMESQLAQLLKAQNSRETSTNEKSQLTVLSEMAAIIAELIANSRYRFDAGTAYYQMVESRLEELEEQEIDELQTLTSFIERRLSPAYRTVLAAKRRLDDLDSRVNRASDLLRTRINMVIETQNQTLLQSMDRRAKMQFNLQQTVEGLSVVVMTYYVLQLFDYMLEAADSLGWNTNKALSISMLMPVVFASVWFLGRRIKKRLNNIE